MRAPDLPDLPSPRKRLLEERDQIMRLLSQAVELSMHAEDQGLPEEAALIRAQITVYWRRLDKLDVRLRREPA